MIAQGRFTPGQTVPSTRQLAAQIGVSFHSVRRAYQDLAAAGVLDAIQGRGFVVANRVSATTSQQMESGAEIVQEALKRLVGLGLSESDIEYLIDEQLSVVSAGDAGPKVVFLGRYAEEAQAGAEFVKQSLQIEVFAAEFADLEHFEDADFVITPYSELRLAMQRLPKADIVGVSMVLPAPVLDRVSRLFSHDTVALLTASPATIQPLSNELRRQTGFPGQILGAPLSGNDGAALQIIDQADAILYTPDARRRLLRIIPSDAHALSVTISPSVQSMRAVSDAISENLR